MLASTSLLKKKRIFTRSTPAFIGRAFKCDLLAVWVLLNFVWLPACSDSRPVAEAQAVDWQQVRGANYVPSYASTSIAIWKNFDPEQINRELGYAKRLRLNSVRMFLQYVVYEHDPELFLDRLEQFVTLADRHGIKPMIVLFDSCFGEEPAIDKDESAKWLNNPGFSRISQPDWSGLENYIRDVVGKYRNDDRILAWDVMNEPMADFRHVTREERDTIWEFCRHFCRRVKELDPSHPVTVGHAAVEYIPKTMDLVDVLSIHSYLAYPDWLQRDIELGLRYGKEAGKPVIFTEFGNPGAGQTYEMALEAIERAGLGFYFWELMIGKIQFKNQSGLIYPDGTIRQTGPIASLLGFHLKKEGGIPIIPPPDLGPVKELLDNRSRWRTYLEEVERIPRTQEAISDHIYKLGMLGRFCARPSHAAQRIFEAGLTMMQLFRMGREQEAVEAYERFLELTREAVEAKLEGEKD